jgi:hypothetical protein
MLISEGPNEMSVGVLDAKWPNKILGLFKVSVKAVEAARIDRANP